MDDERIATFVEAATAWTEAVARAPLGTLADRCVGLGTSLSALYLAGLHLPPESRAPRGAPRVDAVEGWPGLGSFDGYLALDGHEVVERWLSDDVLAIHADVAAGLALFDEDAAAAIAWWKVGFERRWGALALTALLPLHKAMSAFRAEPVGQRAPKRPDLVALEARPPEVQPFVGLQVTPTEGGVEVVAVHPEGPAAGRLVPGDLLVAVDGESLAGLSLDEVRERLGGDIGAARRIEAYRGEDSVEVKIVVASRTAAAAPRPVAPAAPEGRTVTLTVLHAEGATRAAAALRMLGCRITTEGAAMRVAAPASLPDDDLRSLLEAGRTAGVWAPA